uniref:Clathrin/coatomer adaptor adaptin-like N-terminal domain-containing protein n=1 Tax=Zooxanthella nutricula TaxID=1333877 RepID=A0A6V0DNT0_9DINO
MARIRALAAAVLAPAAAWGFRHAGPSPEMARMPCDLVRLTLPVPDSVAVRCLGAMLRVPDTVAGPQSKVRAVELLGEISEGAPAYAVCVAQALEAALHHRNRDVFSKAVEVSANIGQGASVPAALVVVRAFTQALQRRDHDIAVRSVVTNLGRIGLRKPEHVMNVMEALGKAMEHESILVAPEALRVLCKIGQERPEHAKVVIDALAQALPHEGAMVKAEVVEVLRKISQDTPEYVEILKEYFIEALQRQETHVASEIVKVLGEIGQRGPEGMKDVMEVFTQALQHEDMQVAVDVVKVAGDIGQERPEYVMSAVEILARALQHSVERVALEAAQVLGVIGRGSPGQYYVKIVADALKQALQDLPVEDDQLHMAKLWAQLTPKAI